MDRGGHAHEAASWLLEATLEVIEAVSGSADEGDLWTEFTVHGVWSARFP